MNHREFTDRVKDTLGDINFGRLGRLTKKYTREFILDCIESMPDKVIEKGTATDKLNYLTALCQNTYTKNDLAVKRKIKTDKFF